MCDAKSERELEDNAELMCYCKARQQNLTAKLGNMGQVTELSVPWSLRPRNRAAAATCGHGRCDFPAILRFTPKIASG